MLSVFMLLFCHVTCGANLFADCNYGRHFIGYFRGGTAQGDAAYE